jgi:hypothetical protein
MNNAPIDLILGRTGERQDLVTRNISALMTRVFRNFDVLRYLSVTGAVYEAANPSLLAVVGSIVRHGVQNAILGHGAQNANTFFALVRGASIQMSSALLIPPDPG